MKTSKKTKSDKTVYAFRVDKKTLDAVRAWAETNGRSITWTINEALRKFTNLESTQNEKANRV